MPRTVSNNFWEQITARTGDTPYVWALEITHDALAPPIRIARSPSDVVSNGDTFFGSYFDFTAPGETDETTRGAVTIENISQRIGQAVRKIKGEVSCRVMAWLESDPNTLEHDFNFLRMMNFQVNDLTVTAEIWGHDLAGEPCPARRATPEATPGLWVA